MENSSVAVELIKEIVESMKSSLLAELQELRARLGDMDDRMGSIEELLVAREVSTSKHHSMQIIVHVIH